MRTQEEILRELEHLPESLQDLYSIALQQINQLQEAYRHTARTALQLLLVAVRPIPWSEFLHLLSVNPNSGGLVVLKTDVVSMTGNFLLDEDHSGTPRFAHQSAREYLESLPDFESLSSNASAAHICLHHIKQPGNWDSRNFSYSSFYLGNHLGKTHKCQRDTFRPILEELLLPTQNFVEANRFEPLMPESELFQKWRRRISSFQRTGYLGNNRNVDGAELCPATMVSTKPIFAICAMGLAEFLPLLPRKVLQTYEQPQLDFADLSAVGYEALRQYHMRSSLEIAILLHQSDIVATFHQLGLDMDRLGPFNEKPVHLAAKLGNNDILRLLLSFGVDPNSMMSLGVARPEEDSQNTTRLDDTNDERRRPASSLGFHVRVNNRSEIRSPFFFKEESLSILHLAMHTSNAAQCIQTLIEYGASVNLRTSRDVTPLQRCLEYGNLKVTSEVFKILLAAGSRPNDVLPGGQSIVHVVATMGLSNITRLLLEAGADCVTEDHHGQTPYDLARRMGNHEVTAILAVVDAEYRKTHPHKSHELFKHHSTSDIPLFNVELDDSSTTIASDTQPADGEYLSPNTQSKRPKFLTKLVNREWGRLTSGR
ncbi:hypothetical protein PFICI_03617 [Pestalotiopsis fici W106-1]|uniref:Uncharacterized protein n=1 Tax=Pestalotiopsis fici (strain W106-1 / CGMCC3.15140) TaxID=1229662 RepID=W3XJF8_PESFW|nr:uncharacterized protein PFICI_03617 [Pestalotiopsis fici W106-1]ETS85592.1 hypothetical protein PFICI_03617 [Pestalotiopsis fici W106-1]